MQFIPSILLAFLLSLSVQAEEFKGFFIAIGGLNEKSADGEHDIEGKYGTVYTSPDGATWTERYKGGPIKDGFSHARNNLLRCLTFGKELLVATGNPHGVVVSPDGLNWREVRAPQGAFSVEFGNKFFLAPNATGFMRSSDGINWQMVNPKLDFKVWGNDGAGHVRKIVFGNGVFVCIGEHRFGVTRDGSAWLHHEILTAEKRPGRSVLLFGNGRFVWLREVLPSLTSTDGIAWQEIDLSVHSGKGKFGSHGAFDGKYFWASAAVWDEPLKSVYRSADGIKWEKHSETKSLPKFTTVGNGILLGNNGWSKSFTFSSDSGKTWKEAKVNIPSRVVYFFDGKRVIGQSGG